MLQLFCTLSLVFCILNCFCKLTLSVVKGALKNKMYYSFYYVFIIKANHRKTQMLIGQCVFFFFFNDFWDGCSRMCEVHA